MNWALSADSNGAFNLRIPGLAKYTRDVVGERMGKYITDDLSLEELSVEVANEWRDITSQEGKLDQLEIYRAALGLDAHSEVELCRLHRDLMDEADPTVCRKYDPKSSTTVLLSALIPSGLIVMIAIGLVVVERRRRQNLVRWKIKNAELEFGAEERVLGRVSSLMQFLSSSI